MGTMRISGRFRGATLALAVSAVCGAGGATAAELADGPLIQVRDQLLNAEIKNSQGEQLGEIEELVMDRQGRIQYVVISHGGFLDIGDKVVAVPWQSARLQMGADGHVIMGLTREQLAQAPSFEKDKWPDMNDQAWNARVDTFTGSYVASHKTTPADTSATFDGLDVNRDGHLSTQEAKAQPLLAARYDELDRNGDGQLSRWEFNAFDAGATVAEGQPSSPSEKARAALTEEEQQRRERIAQSSTQQNVTKDAATFSESSRGGGNTGKSAGQSGKQTVQGGAAGQESAAKPSDPKLAFGKLDANADGKLSRDEVKASATLNQRFSEVDRNNDGGIDQAEFSAFESKTARGGRPDDTPSAGGQPAAKSSQD